MSQLSTDPLRNAALNELLSVDAAALRTARRNDFHNELSRAQQRREPPSPTEPPNTRDAPAGADSNRSADSADAADSERRRANGTEPSSQSPSGGSPPSSAADEDRRVEDDEAKDCEQTEAAAPGEGNAPSSGRNKGESASRDAGEATVVAVADAPNDAGPKADLFTAAGGQAAAEQDSPPAAASGQTDAPVPATAADLSQAAEQQAQTPIEAGPRGPGPVAAASAVLERDQRDKAASPEQAADSGEQHREQSREKGATKTGSATSEIDIEALRAATGGALPRNGRGEAAEGNSGPRRAPTAADARAGARRSRTADTPTVADVAAAQAATADLSPETTTTIAPPAVAVGPTIAVSAPTAAPSAPLPASAAPEAAPPAIGVRPASAKTPSGVSATADDGSPRDASGGIDRARFVQRVAGAFRALNEHNHTLRLKLSPPELGSLRIEITVRNGQMSARLEAETPEARNLLLDHLPALRERLAGQEIKIQQFHVEVADRQPGGGTFHTGQEESRRREARAASSGGPARGKPAVSAVETVRDSRLVGGDGRLNVIV